jgi:hypothetical protein
MHIRSFLRTLFAILVVCAFARGSAALAQGFEEQFENDGADGAGNASALFKNVQTAAQTTQVGPAVAPRMQGATNGNIGPQGANATYVDGLNTAGTVRVNNLANMECLMNVMSNGMEVIGIAWGGPTMIMAFMQLGAGAPDGWKRVMNGGLAVLGGLAQPAWNNWLVASARDANLFQ